jgi:hypothetical protein
VTALADALEAKDRRRVFTRRVQRYGLELAEAYDASLVAIPVSSTGSCCTTSARSDPQTILHQAGSLDRASGADAIRGWASTFSTAFRSSRAPASGGALTPRALGRPGCGRSRRREFWPPASCARRRSMRHDRSPYPKAALWRPRSTEILGTTARSSTPAWSRRLRCASSGRSRRS